MTANILASDLLRIREYKELKVFLLIGLKGDELVIKTDAVSAQQIKSASVAAKAISHNSRMKILTDSERRELELYCKYFEELDAYYEDIGVASPFRDQKDAVKNLKDSLGFGFPFGKMIKERILDLQGAMDQRSSGVGGEGYRPPVRGYAERRRRTRDAGEGGRG